MPKCNNRFSLKALAAAVSATVALGVVALPTLSHADETACSPFTPLIKGQEDLVYVWTLGVEGIGDGSDKLVTVDVRPGSKTFGQWYGVELSQENRRAFYLPEGMAHGFITLEDATEAAYMASAAYAPDLERGVRWNDPKFKIDWPLQPHTISDKDANWRDFDPSWHLPSPVGVS